MNRSGVPTEEANLRVGAVAPDGSPVEFYRLAPEGGEATIIHEALPFGCEILELGCGAGRITHRLLEFGHVVVAVDNSADMLAYVRGAQTIQADIEELDIGRTFPGVVLASNLVNTTDRAQRVAFLDTCARHVDADGSVVIQRSHPQTRWVQTGVSEWVVGEVRILTRVLGLRGSIVHAVTEYSIRERTWLQEYRTELLDDDAMEKALSESGLALDRWLDDQGEWIEARRYSVQG